MAAGEQPAAVGAPLHPVDRDVVGLGEGEFEPAGEVFSCERQ
jgi:hypothetical protein